MAPIKESLKGSIEAFICVRSVVDDFKFHRVVMCNIDSTILYIVDHGSPQQTVFEFVVVDQSVTVFVATLDDFVNALAV